jgi:hypothetical protein
VRRKRMRRYPKRPKRKKLKKARRKLKAINRLKMNKLESLPPLFLDSLLQVRVCLAINLLNLSLCSFFSKNHRKKLTISLILNLSEDFLEPQNQLVLYLEDLLRVDLYSDFQLQAEEDCSRVLDRIMDKKHYLGDKHPYLVKATLSLLILFKITFSQRILMNNKRKGLTMSHWQQKRGQRWYWRTNSSKRVHLKKFSIRKWRNLRFKNQMTKRKTLVEERCRF